MHSDEIVRDVKRRRIATSKAMTISKKQTKIDGLLVRYNETGKMMKSDEIMLSVCDYYQVKYRCRDCHTIANIARVSRKRWTKVTFIG